MQALVLKRACTTTSTSKIIKTQFLNRITRENIDDQISFDEAVKKINAELAKFSSLYKKSG